MSGKIGKRQRSIPIRSTGKNSTRSTDKNSNRSTDKNSTRSTRKRQRLIPTRSTGKNSNRSTDKNSTRSTRKRQRNETQRFSPPQWNQWNQGKQRKKRKQGKSRQKTPNPNGKYTKDSFEIMMYAIASVFISNETFTNKLTSINELLTGELGKKFREVLTGGSTPDTECYNARKRAEKNRHTSAPAIDYKHITERNNGLLTSKVKGIKTHTRVKNDKGNFIKVKFLAKKKGYCGKCWMCGLDVNYYLGDGFVTSCGQCEHIGAITASFLTGMLTSADLDIMSYNYGTSHVHCNQYKWSIISMKFDNNALWKYDIVGAQEIANKIINSKMHDTEYDTIFKTKFAEKMKKKVLFTQQIITNIEGVTIEWCKVANLSIVGVDNNKKKKGAKLAELAREITIELMKKTKKYQNLIKGGTTPMQISNELPNNNRMVIDDKDKPHRLVTPTNNNRMVIDDKDKPHRLVTDDKDKPPRLVTPPVELSTEIDEEHLKEKFKEEFGEKLFNLLSEFHTVQNENAEYRDEFKKNLDTAIQTIDGLKELNKALEEFHSQE